MSTHWLLAPLVRRYSHPCQPTNPGSGGVESASAPAPTNGTDTESHADSPKATPVGAIVGGVIGGFIFLALVLSAVFWIFKKKKRPRDTTIESEMVGVLPAQSTGAPSSVWGNMDGYSALSSPPPVADPMVFDVSRFKLFLKQPLIYPTGSTSVWWNDVAFLQYTRV